MGWLYRGMGWHTCITAFPAARPWTRLPHHAASLIRAARRARTAWARLSSTASELSQPMQPSVMLWP